MALVCAFMLPINSVLAEAPLRLHHTAPLVARPGEPLEVEGALPNHAQLARVVLRYRGPGDPWTELQMHLQYGELFRAYIPATQMIPPGVEYHVVGVLPTGGEVPLFSDPERPARVFVRAVAAGRGTTDAGVPSKHTTPRR